MNIKNLKLYGSFLLLSTNILLNSNNVVAKENINKNIEIELNDEVSDKVKKYSDIYELNYKVIEDKLKNVINMNYYIYLNDNFNLELTNKMIYSNIDLMKANSILTKELKSADLSWQYENTINHEKYTSLDQAILNSVIDIKYNYSNYEINESDLYNFSSYDKEEEGYGFTYYELDNYLDSDDKTDYLINKIIEYSEILGVNPKVSLSISMTECGKNLDSSMLIGQNNFGGMLGYSYSNIDRGIIAFIYMLKNNYNLTMDSDLNSLSNIASTYCTDAGHWMHLNNDNYYYIENNYMDDIKEVEKTLKK